MYLLSYFKSLPHDSIANQGHSIVLSLHKNSPFSFKQKSECMSKPHGSSPTSRWFISSRKMEQTGKDDLLQRAPASCYSNAPSSTDLCLGTPGLLFLPSAMSCISMESIPGIQEALWHRGDKKCTCYSCPSAGQRTGAAKPQWNKAGIAVQWWKVWHEVH